MKRKIYWKLTFLSDRLPKWMCPPIDYLRYEVFFPDDFSSTRCCPCPENPDACKGECTCHHTSVPSAWSPPKPAMDTSKVNRVEVINHTKPVEEGGGRVYNYWHKYHADDVENPTVEVHLQDQGKTLKIFIQ